jgi:glycolate oxidase FAD binding subunit
MLTDSSIVEGLGETVGSERIRSGAEIASYRLGLLTPRVAAFPENEDDVARLLAFACREGLGVVPWGGGAHQSVGAIPARYDVAIDLGRMDRLIEHEPADMTATAQAGIRMAELDRCLGRHDQFLPLDPPLLSRATLGGLLASRLSGPLACRYGTARDLILGLRIAQADGTVIRAGSKVVKNASAYDMTKLYLGSYGTLGVILEATFRVHPRPTVEKGWWIAVPDLESSLAVGIRILRSSLVPSRTELVDGPALRVLGGPPTDSALLVSIAGVAEAVAGQASDLALLAAEFGLTLVEFQPPEGGWAAVADFPWINPAFSGTGRRAIWRANVLPTECARAMRDVQQAVKRWAEATMIASVSQGAVRGAFYAESLEAIGQSLAAAREALKAIGGILVILEVPDSLRSECDMWGVVPSASGLMQRLKAAVDPKRILNPGRFVNGM